MSALTSTTESAQDRLNRAITHYLERTPVDSTINFGTVGEAGSAGKTTTIVTFAALLAQAGFHIELFDLDGQGNLSKHFGIGVAEEDDDNLLVLHKEYSPGVTYPAPLTLGDALVGRKATFPGEHSDRPVTLDDIRRCAYNEAGIPGYGVITDDEVSIEWLSRIHIYPNGPSYLSGELISFYEDEAFLQAKNPLAGMVLPTMVNKLQTRPHFRGFDLHGTKSMSMMSALVTMHRAINCVGLDDKTTGSDLRHLVSTVEQVQAMNTLLKLAMILPCRVKSGPQRGRFGHRMRERLDRRYGELVPDIAIRDSVQVTEAYHAREPLPMWVPNEAVTDDYRHALAWAFENGVFAKP